MSMTEQQDSEISADSDNDAIVAPADQRYRAKHLLFAIIIFVVGFWFAYDGWIAWPRHNTTLHALESQRDAAKRAGNDAKYEELKAKIGDMHKEYTDWDLGLQRAIALVLPFLGIGYGIWTHLATRGQYRLSGNSLEVPGLDDAIDLVDIERIDRSKWDRKGIAIIYYQAHHPQRMRTIKLDDFAYQRKPTDEILERIQNFLAPPAELPPAAVPPSEAQ